MWGERWPADELFIARTEAASGRIDIVVTHREHSDERATDHNTDI